MSYLNNNIRYLRKLRGFTQAELAEKLGLKRSLIGAYEEGRAEPKITTIQKLSALFQTTIDSLIDADLQHGVDKVMDIAGRALRVLPIVVTPDEKERLSVVPIKAKAGYAEGYGDPEYIETLPQFSLPLEELYPDQTSRLFQVSGDSMLPIQPGSYIIASYVEDWYSIKDGQCYIVVTKEEGVVYKRLWSHPARNSIQLKSDNPVYKPYELHLQAIAEIWQAEGYISFDLPTDDTDGQLGELKDMMDRLQRQLSVVKETMTGGVSSEL